MISASVDEARDSVESLTTVVRQVLQSNQDIVQRLSNLECLSTRGKASQTGRTASTLDDGRSTFSSQSKAEVKLTETPGISLVPFSFDQDLIASWVYSRAERRRSADSLRSSAAVSFGWSCLSEISLANVSNISVVSLPIDIRELTNSAHYRPLRHATLPRNLHSLATRLEAKTFPFVRDSPPIKIVETDDKFVEIDDAELQEPADPHTFYALYTYKGPTKDGVNVVEGNALALLDDSNSSWWFVRSLQNQSSGKYTPINFSLN